LLVAGLGVGGLLVGFGWLAGGADARRILRAVIVIAALLFLVPATLSAFTGRWLFVPHFGLQVLAAVMVVIAAGAVEAGARVRWMRGSGFDGRAVTASVAVAWCVMGAIGIWLFRTAPPHGADGLRELVARLESAASAGDPVLVSPAILSPSVAHYTDRPLTGIPDAFDLRNLYGPHLRPPSDATLREATRAASSDHPRVWLVHRPEEDPNGAVLA
jgi:hypothetical protein